MAQSYDITEEIKPKSVSYKITEITRITMRLQEILGDVEKDDKLPYGYGLFLKEKIDADYAYVNQAYHRLKTYLHGSPSREFFGFREFTMVQRSERNKFIMSQGYGRGCPAWERDACNKLICGLKKLPDGGIALIIGSPAPLSVARKNGNLISDDNLEVIHIAKYTTKYPGIIIIGNLVNDTKATQKCHDFKELNSISSSFRVFKGPVTAATLKRIIKKLAKEYPLVKVILMTSGLWKHSNTHKIQRPELAKYDLNFYRASLDITNKFNNVHILAMARGSEPGYGFSVEYVHKGKQSTIPKPESKSI